MSIEHFFTRERFADRAKSSLNGLPYYIHRPWTVFLCFVTLLFFSMALMVSTYHAYVIVKQTGLGIDAAFLQAALHARSTASKDHALHLRGWKPVLLSVPLLFLPPPQLSLALPPPSLPRASSSSPLLLPSSSLRLPNLFRYRFRFGPNALPRSNVSICSSYLCFEIELSNGSSEVHSSFGNSELNQRAGSLCDSFCCLRSQRCPYL